MNAGASATRAEKPLAGRGAVVTGAGSGIGAAVARALADAGAAVVLAARTTAGVESVAASIRAAGGRAWGVGCDVTEEASVRALGEEARRRLGDVDILVNNAGEALSAPLAKTTLSDWSRMLAVNATGVFLCTREFAPAMAERRRGRIVTVASTAGLSGGKYIGAYAAAKHAAIGFTKSAALELADRGVTVNAVCPGYADTPMTERTIANVAARTGLGRDAALAAILEAGGQTRLVAPGEVAAEVRRLSLDEASGITGQSIVINGFDGETRPR
ncbi:MAG TPA: SDR family NAD(P)-dependent oxidoreductase [Candidatus Eisenbacteria bacterium]|nr:SDR family NAD(P)-dependent oxidoreductase [Candidatus Eisenbacteria bacterium]